jgi:hypothetical protein
MPRYTARWLQIPLEQYDALPDQAQRQVDLRVAELLEEPEGPSQAYDPAHRSVDYHLRRRCRADRLRRGAQAPAGADPAPDLTTAPPGQSVALVAVILGATMSSFWR